MLNSVRCSFIDDTWVSSVDQSIACYSVSHISFAIPAIIGITCLGLITSLYCGLIFDHRLSSGNIMAKIGSHQSIIFHILRSILCILFFGIPIVYTFIIYFLK